jgi:class 3 adenylate cyclase/tetratricopeptide (TPR) repeat protein
MPDTITQWLHKLGLDRYAEVFAEQEILFGDLSELTDADLKELGIPLGPRKRLLKALLTLTQERSAPAESATTEPDASLATWERNPGERKPVTILFADITGSTALTEKLDAEEAHEILYGAIQKMCAAVERNHGTVCKLLGDGLMAMFGAPMANEQHAVDACVAALEMQHAIHKNADGAGTGSPNELQIRVGLHSGEVVVLEVGEGDKMEYDASGPTVPVAARMEQVAEPGQVYITGATRSLAGGRIESDALDSISVKGVSEPVAVYALRRVRSTEEALQDGGLTPFVGRRAEINQCRGMLEACIEEGQGQTIYVRGEPGIGKTRLIDEFKNLAVEKGMSAHRGFVLPFGVGKGQDAIRSLVRSLLDIAPGSNKSERKQAADKARIDGRLESADTVFINDLLDLQQPTKLRALYDAMDPATRNTGQQSVVAQLVTSACIRQPCLVIVEDLHWADPITVAHMAALKRIVSELPALLVMTSRVEGDPLGQAWRTSAGGGGIATIELGPLRRQDYMKFIDRFVADDSLAEDCLERAAGNPLFLEQLLRSSQEGITGNLPDSIQTLVLARVDRLGESDKQALQAASVIGQKFDSALLDYLLEETGSDYVELVKHNLIRIDGASCMFTHALIQEGVYGSLLRRRRQALHRKCADYFMDSDPVLYAEHLGYARDPGAAGAFLEAADDQAGKYRFEHALSLVERGLAMSGEKNILHGLMRLKGEILHELDDVESSITAFQELLEQANDDSQRFDAWMGLAAGKRVTNDFEEALELLDNAEVVANRQQITGQLSKIHHLRGNLFYGTGNIDGCRSAHILALENARDSGSIEDEARALGGIADAECARGRMRSAYESFQLCVDRCRKIGLGRVEVANWSQMANCFSFLGKSEEVLKSSKEAVAAAVSVGHLRAEMNALEGICNVALNTGDVEMLGTYAERGSAIAGQLQSHAWDAYYLSLSAVAHYLGGDYSRAGEIAQAAVGLGDSSRAFTGGWTLGALAMVAEVPETRANALREGDLLLAQGVNGEAHLHFIRYAMLACLGAGMWDELERYAEAMDVFTQAEPLPWADFAIAQSRVLAKVGRGERSDFITRELARLISVATNFGYTASFDSLETAIGEL